MSTRWYSVEFDAADPGTLARFWSEMTGWPVVYEDDVEVVVEGGAGMVPLGFIINKDTKVGKNRVHLDLGSRSPEHQAELVARAERLGGTRIDIGQGDVPWVVLADPEGNEFCVLDPRDEYAQAGAIAAVVLDSPDPAAVAAFWAAATGWVEGGRGDGFVSLVPPGGTGPHLELLRTPDAKVVKNRLHLDMAPFAADDQAAEVARLEALGATRIDIGQGTPNWVVLADPQGSELCVLSVRD